MQGKVSVDKCRQPCGPARKKILPTQRWPRTSAYNTTERAIVVVLESVQLLLQSLPPPPPQEDNQQQKRRMPRSLAARLYAELINAQVGFCSMWLLDNVLPQAGRVYTFDRTDTALIKVMLDVKDATAELKLAPDGLEARNDSVSFESVKVGAGDDAERSDTRARKSTPFSSHSMPPVLSCRQPVRPLGILVYGTMKW